MTNDRDYLAAGLATGGLSDDDQRAAVHLEAMDAAFRAMVDEYRELLADDTADVEPLSPSADLTAAILSIPSTVERPDLTAPAEHAGVSAPVTGAQVADAPSTSTPHAAGAPVTSAPPGADTRTPSAPSTDATPSESIAAPRPASLHEHRRARNTASAPRKHWRALPALAAAAAVLAILVLGATTVRMWALKNDAQDQQTIAQQEASAAQQLLSAPDLASKQLTLTTGGSITVNYSASKQLMSVTSHNATVSDPDKALQLWMINDGKPVSAGMLDAHRGVFTPPQMGKGSVLGVTVEPMGGSQAPTSAPVATAEM